MNQTREMHEDEATYETRSFRLEETADWPSRQVGLGLRNSTIGYNYNYANVCLPLQP